MTNFFLEITPYRKKLVTFKKQMKNLVGKKQDWYKHYTDKTRQSTPQLKTDDSVRVTLNPVRQTERGKFLNLIPQCDGLWRDGVTTVSYIAHYFI
ncbi:hypothetical protein CEXT_691661 [Caerostris extrusa]|uniref:Uncharacterized protein n=1 Tax=Caerostris extrusa TaxID=172846 RepID=A0AAV4SD12_CAEEX|nr:hypothetical protein CEXT_691661 [Caerostris extrusa]